MSSHEKVTPSEEMGRTHATHKENNTQVRGRGPGCTRLTGAK